MPQPADGLTYILQKSVDTGCLPADWTNANAAPVVKKGNKHLAENYRSVSLTSYPIKIKIRLDHPDGKVKPKQVGVDTITRSDSLFLSLIHI